jgi:hypothetical protein
VSERHIFMAVAVVSLLNGLFSPFVVLVYSLVPFWLPEFVPATPSIALMLSAMITAFGTLLLSGIPAALYERLTGARDSTFTSMCIWLAAAVLMSLPAVPVIAGLI